MEQRHLRNIKLSAGCFETYVDFPGDDAKGFSFCLPLFWYLRDTLFQFLELIHFLQKRAVLFILYFHHLAFDQLFP